LERYFCQCRTGCDRGPERITHAEDAILPHRNEASTADVISVVYIQGPCV